ncbi:MAG: DEAD/DEAH box helicase [Thermodesulfobacteriota bacterium]
MSLLSDIAWQLKYSPEDGDLLHRFYIPALECAVRYDRSTGFFRASTLTAASRGVEGLIRNQGRMRLIVGCTLDEPEAEAISRGESLRETVEARLLRLPLTAEDAAGADALELLAWMVAQGFLDVKIAVPCDADRKPVTTGTIFHEKAGIIEDKTGARIAFNGSINESRSGWTGNFESFHVFTSWGTASDRVDAEEVSFGRLWADKARTAIVIDVPAAVRSALLAFLPKENMRPRRLEACDDVQGWQTHATTGVHPIPKLKEADGSALFDLPPDLPETPPEPIGDPRKIVWSFIRTAPTLPGGGERIGEATGAVTPWPHQVRAFQRMYDHWPPRLLIADEVGLGKTIQAGLLLRQAWLAGRAKRILVLAPKAVLTQWQIELREKFNLNWPIYDGRKFSWYPSRALEGATVRQVDTDRWHDEPCVLTSSHLMRRRDRVRELLESADPWDLVVLDEAHHARRRGGGIGASDDRPNQLLRLMQGLRNRTEGLILLTATPMQVSPIEVWDLLNLFGLPPEWHADAFLKFFEDAAMPMPGNPEMDAMAALFRSIEAAYGEVSDEEARRFASNRSKIKGRKILRALRDASNIPRRRLETDERRAAVRLMKAHTPIKRLISRHTRDLLRKYHQSGSLDTRIADRDVQDRSVIMTDAEQSVYRAVEDYISTTYNNADPDKRTAIGFVMTIYRRRLASSFHALARTLENRLCSVAGQCDPLPADPGRLEEDVLEDELSPEIMDAEEAAEMEAQVLAQEEKGDLEMLLDQIRRLPTDTKAAVLLEVLADLRADGFGQVMVFTQYTDTLDFLRSMVADRFGPDAVLCFSGRGGEIMDRDGSWRPITRESTKQRFKAGKADIMLCTDAAAEGLNFQFCGALINYDMPWNPMKVEQRIGRIDRLGQAFDTIRILNLLYEDTVETDVYRALRKRIGLFTNFVGKLQPILAKLPRAISEVALGRPQDKERDRTALISTLTLEADQLDTTGFDLDEAAAEELTPPARPEALYGLTELNRILASDGLLPPGIEAQKLGAKDFTYLAPGMKTPIRVTTDPDYFDAHPESTELWSPGSPLFPVSETPPSPSDADQDVFRRVLKEKGGGYD